MKHIVGNLLLFVSLLLCPYGAFAENKVTSVEVSPSSGSSTVVVKDGVIHNLNSVDVDLSIEGVVDECKAGSAKCDYVLKLSGTEVTSGSLNLSEKVVNEKQKSLSGKVSLTGLNETGTYTFEAKFTWKNEKSEDQTMSKNSDFTVRIYADPNVKVKDTKGVLFSGQSIKFSQTVDGGNYSGWKYEWVGQGSTDRDYVYTASNSTDDKKIENITVKAINYGPDGKTVWGSFTNKFTVTSWPKPVADNDGKNSLEVKSEDKYSLSANVKGGDASKWEYKWRLDGSLVSLDPVLNDKHKVTKYTTFNYTLELTNAPTGMDKANQYHQTLNYQVICWDIPTMSRSSEQKQVAFSGDNVTFAVQPKGGNSKGWTYKWSEGQSDGPNLVYTTSYTGEGSTVKTITVQATNRTNSGMELFTGSVDFQVEVWRIPTVKAVGEVVNEFFKGDVADFVVETEGGDQNAWTYSWSFNGAPLDEKTNKFTFDTKTVQTSYDGELQTHKVVVKNSPAGVKKPFEQEIEFKTTLWSEPAYKSHQVNEGVTCSRRENKLTVDVTGSTSKRWTYTWKKNGTLLPEAKTAVYKYVQEDVESKTDDVYTVVVENHRDGEVIYSKECTFNVEVWPEPQVNGSVADLDKYWGSTIQTPMEMLGGYETGWSYTMTVDGEEVEGVDTNFEFTVPSDAANGKDYHIVCTLRNDFETANWFYKTYEYTVHGWSQGKVTAEEMDSIDVAVAKPSVRHSSKVDLHPNVEGGYAKGWRFAWSKNGSPMEKESNSDLSFIADNQGDSYVDDEYKLEYSNTLEEVVGTSGELIYNMRIWAEARFPEKIEGPSVVRKEIPVQLSVTPAELGYYNDPESNWHYIWDGKDNQKNTIDFVTGKVSSSDEKYISEKTYKLSIVNYGPNKSEYGNGNNPWNGRDYEHTLKIYNAPKIPDALKIKGNGNSNTMIAIYNDLTDSDLKKREYKLVFGYSIGNVDYTYEAPENLRYLTFKADVFHKINWVYAKWVYSDGSIVTSGKRYLDGHLDRYFDVSTFDGDNRSPSDITGVEENQMDEVKIEGNRIKAVLSQKLPARVSIYNVNGRLLDRQILTERYEYDEPLYTAQLRAGIYMVEVIVGSQRVVRKIYVH